MGLVEGYELHLYCDAQEACRHQSGKYGGHTKAEARKNARMAGWSLNPRGKETEDGIGHGRAVCPLCNDN